MYCIYTRMRSYRKDRRTRKNTTRRKTRRMLGGAEAGTEAGAEAGTQARAEAGPEVGPGEYVGSPTAVVEEASDVAGEETSVHAVRALEDTIDKSEEFVRAIQSLIGPVQLESLQGLSSSEDSTPSSVLSPLGNGPHELSVVKRAWADLFGLNSGLNIEDFLNKNPMEVLLHLCNINFVNYKRISELVNTYEHNVRIIFDIFNQCSRQGIDNSILVKGKSKGGFGLTSVQMFLSSFVRSTSIYDSEGIAVENHERVNKDNLLLELRDDDKVLVETEIWRVKIAENKRQLRILKSKLCFLKLRGIGINDAITKPQYGIHSGQSSTLKDELKQLYEKYYVECPSGLSKEEHEKYFDIFHRIGDNPLENPDPDAFSDDFGTVKLNSTGLQQALLEGRGLNYTDDQVNKLINAFRTPQEREGDFNADEWVKEDDSEANEAHLRNEALIQKLINSSQPTIGVDDYLILMAMEDPLSILSQKAVEDPSQTGYGIKKSKRKKKARKKKAKKRTKKRTKKQAGRKKTKKRTKRR